MSAKPTRNMSSFRIDPGERLVMRQMLPTDYRGFRRDEYQRMWRWVLWSEEAITFDEALAMRRVSTNEHWCLVYVERGPKGGWTGATFVQLRHKMPAMRKSHTWYMGWVFLDHKPSHKNVPAGDLIDAAAAAFDRQRASMALHT
jgi:hypothetical protein